MNNTFVQVYTFTIDSSEKVIEEFYETLQGALDNIPKKDMTVLMGDRNAKIQIGKSKVKTKNMGWRALVKTTAVPVGGSKGGFA